MILYISNKKNEDILLTKCDDRILQSICWYLKLTVRMLGSESRAAGAAANAVKCEPGSLATRH